MAPKTFALRAEQLRPLVRGMGGCIASDRITVDGRRVGSMVRDPSRSPEDSGWLFLAGDETQDYLDDPNHLSVYDVNTIANYDPAIIPFLFALPGQCFDRRGEKFVEAPDSRPDKTKAGLPAGWSVVQGKVSLAGEWMLALPTPFRRRVEEGSDVLWRPGLTFWISTAKGSGPTELRLNELRGAISVDATQVRSDERGGLFWLTYRLREDSPVAALYAHVLSATGKLTAAAYFDHEDDALVAREITDAIRQTTLSA